MLGTEKEGRKNVSTAAHANDGDVGWCLHQVCGIDDVVFQIGELADIAGQPGYWRARACVHVEEVLVYLRFMRVGEAPADWNALAERPHPHAGECVPALEECSHLLCPLGP